MSASNPAGARSPSPCDVTHWEDVQAALQKAVDAYGRLDVAFNNAGGGDHGGRVEPDHRRHLRGVFLCLKYEIPLMLKQGLCSDAASFVLGHALVIDGGQTT